MTLPYLNVTWPVPVGGSPSVQFVITAPGGGVYNITGLAWELRVRTSVSDTSTTPLIEVTQTANAAGVISVNTTTATVTVTLYPAATQTMAPGAYSWALWSNPGNTTTAQPWIGGIFVVDPVVQP